MDKQYHFLPIAAPKKQTSAGGGIKLSQIRSHVATRQHRRRRATEQLKESIPEHSVASVDGQHPDLPRSLGVDRRLQPHTLRTRLSPDLTYQLHLYDTADDVALALHSLGISKQSAVELIVNVSLPRLFDLANKCGIRKEHLEQKMRSIGQRRLSLAVHSLLTITHVRTIQQQTTPASAIHMLKHIVIQELQTALHSPEIRTTVETMYSLMILSNFEALYGTSEAYLVHMRGLSLLVKMAAEDENVREFKRTLMWADLNNHTLLGLPLVFAHLVDEVGPYRSPMLDYAA